MRACVQGLQPGFLQGLVTGVQHSRVTVAPHFTERELHSHPKRTNYLGKEEHGKQGRTYFVPRAADAHPILEGGVCHSLQGLRLVLRKAEVVVGAHVDDIVQCPPSEPAGR